MITVAYSFNIINCILIIITILIYLFIFFVLTKRIRNQQDISILLNGNTCLAAFLTTLTTLIMTSSNLSQDQGFLTRSLTFCYIWGFLYDMLECISYSIDLYRDSLLVDYKIYASIDACIDSNYSISTTTTQFKRSQNNQTFSLINFTSSNVTFSNDYFYYLRFNSWSFISFNLRCCWFDYVNMFDTDRINNNSLYTTITT